jgi:hypothetical protein
MVVQVNDNKSMVGSFLAQTVRFLSITRNSRKLMLNIFIKSANHKTNLAIFIWKHEPILLKRPVDPFKAFADSQSVQLPHQVDAGNYSLF